MRRVRTRRIDLVDGKGQCGFVERAVHVVEDGHHVVTDASGEEVGRLVLELDRAAHLGENAVRVVELEDILEVVENDAGLSVGGDLLERGHDGGSAQPRRAGAFVIRAEDETLKR